MSAVATIIMAGVREIERLETKIEIMEEDVWDQGIESIGEDR